MRRVYLHRPGHPLADSFGMVEIIHVDPAEAELAVSGPPHVSVVGDSHHDGTRSPIDGADISTRKKRREYMKQNGLADFDDFKGVWEKKDAERAAMREGHFQEKERREAVEKAWYQVTEKGYKPQASRAEVLGAEATKKDAGVMAISLDSSAVPGHDQGPVELKEAD